PRLDARDKLFVQSADTLGATWMRTPWCFTTRPAMQAALENVNSLSDLRTYIHETLCDREKLLSDQFSLMEAPLRCGLRECGRQFTLFAPRTIRLGAIGAADHNPVYFYTARGERSLNLRLPNRLAPAS